MKKLLQYIVILTSISLIYILGEMNGIPEGNLLGNFFAEFFAPYKTIEPKRYYFVLTTIGTWFLIFCFLNLKYFATVSKIMTARLGWCLLVSILLMLIYLMIGTGYSASHIPLSYNEWPVDFSTFLYEEDGLLESLTAICLLLASVNFYLAGKSASKNFHDRRIIIALFLLSTFSVFIFMEEISWGQHIFLWETPEAIKVINYQQETNLHNIFNPIIVDAQRIIAIFISLALLAAILCGTQITSPTLRSLFPSAKYYYLPLIFAVAAMLSSELFEELFAVFLFFYSIDQKKIYFNESPREVVPGIRTMC